MRKRFDPLLIIDDIETYFSTPLPSQTKRMCANVEEASAANNKLGFIIGN
jgi:hypothetical protein